MKQKNLIRFNLQTSKENKEGVYRPEDENIMYLKIHTEQNVNLPETNTATGTLSERSNRLRDIVPSCPYTITYATSNLPH